MDRPSIYDDDIVAWAEEQAIALRVLAARPDLSNAVDWENVAEEVESVGRSEVDRVESAIEQMLIHLLKYASAPSAQPRGSWRREVVVFHASASRNYRTSMRQKIDWERLWRSVLRQADASLNVFGDRLMGGLPVRMPFTPEELVAEDFDMDAGLTKLAEALKRHPNHP